MPVYPVAYSDNPQTPNFYSELYIPDQLIAGDLKLVTSDETLTGTTPLNRGTVLGKTKFGAIVATAGKAFASGTIEVSAVPSASDTLTVNATPLTFVAIPENQDSYPQSGDNIVIPLNPTTASVAAAIGFFLANSTDSNISKMTFSLSGSTVTATSKLPGSTGNAYTLATSDSTALTLSGATLSGGTANAGAETISTVTAGPEMKPGNYIVELTSTTAFSVTAPNGDLVGNGTVGTAFVSSHVNFTITTGSGIAAGDAFYIFADPSSGGFVKLCVASATDGSNTPYGLLVDYSDPSSGNINVGVYLMGEFNQNAIWYDPSFSLSELTLAFQPLQIFLKPAISSGPPL
jgi:hypothetical protein